MKIPAMLIRITVAIVSLVFANATIAATPVKGGKSRPAVEQTSLREVNYPDLESKIGAKLVIHTTNNTTRTGNLISYSNVTLVVKLGPESGSIELAVPRSTIRKVMVEIGAADPLFPTETTPTEGKPGAKKN
ncbi:MAG: hypothetical protein WAS23_15135 [Dokdonella sp.]|uniref:hypothetical protein n=1 Tax=Dokdonella sp. TaxID=2291710 RepID=UPI003BAFA974